LPRKRRGKSEVALSKPPPRATLLGLLRNELLQFAD
jgi:hypothetical protein